MHCMLEFKMKSEEGKQDSYNARGSVFPNSQWPGGPGGRGSPDNLNLACKTDMSVMQSTIAATVCGCTRNSIIPMIVVKDKEDE